MPTHVLLIDPDPLRRRARQRSLVSHGLRVTTARDAAEALAHLPRWTR